MSLNPDDLRQRAEQADIAGDENLANSLRDEADELENASPTEGDAAPQ